MTTTTQTQDRRNVAAEQYRDSLPEDEYAAMLAAAKAAQS